MFLYAFKSLWKSGTAVREIVNKPCVQGEELAVGVNCWFISQYPCQTGVREKEEGNRMSCFL